MKLDKILKTDLVIVVDMNYDKMRVFLLSKKSEYRIFIPDENLPSNIITLARGTVGAIENGSKYLVLTNSDFFIREINSLIMLSKGGEKAKELMYEYNIRHSIKPENVSIYLYDAETEDYNKIEVNETGFEIESIDKVINDQNEQGRDIYMTLFE